MQVNNEGIGDDRLISATQAQAAALDIIRTETELSKYPIHNLAKKGSVNIQILRTTPDGKVELKWIVSYSDRYGQARQLAYKLDTIVINRHIDEAGRPLPKMICLGSLREVADELDLGGDTNKVRRALRQNASAFITAKFEYRGNDGSKRNFEADFTRYSVVFTGEQLPDGRRADAVYIILNDPYREVLNTAPVRPLDRAYMKELPPAAQRFYEIVSRKIFAALKNNYPTAKISYSEYCMFSAQLRHYERQRVQDQMAKVLRNHKESGYITAVKYEPTIDAENKPDWILYLTPGPRARAEFDAAHGRRHRKTGELSTPGVGEYKRYRKRDYVAAQKIESASIPVPVQFDRELVSEFTHRGIAEQQAMSLLANLKPGQDVIAQLELSDSIIQNSTIPIPNPAGYRVRLIQRNIDIPDGFETSANRKAREERERKEKDLRAAEDAEHQLEWEYDDYREREIDRYIEANPAVFEAIKNARWKEDREKFSFTTESMAKLAARFEICKQIPLLTFTEFLDQRKQGTDFFLKQVTPPPPADTITPDAAAFADASPQEETSDQGQTDAVPEGPVPAERGDAHAPAESATDPATNPAIEPLTVELASAGPDVAAITEDPVDPTESNQSQLF